LIENHHSLNFYEKRKAAATFCYKFLLCSTKGNIFETLKGE